MIQIEKDWIYYTGEFNDSKKIYRIKTDGTLKKRLTDFDVDDFYISEDYLFFTTFEKYGTINNLYYMQEDSSFKYKLTSENIYSFDVFGKWICFSEKGDESRRFYIIDTLGNYKTMILEDSPYYYYLYNDWIYYSDFFNDYGIYKISLDGLKKEMIVDDCAIIYSVCDDWIFYQNEYEKTFCKIKTDGTGKKVLDKGTFCNVTLSGDYIYYTDDKFEELGIHGGNIYRLRTDGSIKEKINSDVSSNIFICGNTIYYIVPNALGHGQLFSIRIDGTQKVMLNEEYSSIFDAKGEYVYFLSMGKEISNSIHERKVFRIKHDGTCKQHLFSVELEI